jgi:membrane-associated phospholipid phosphatase
MIKNHYDLISISVLLYNYDYLMRFLSGQYSYFIMLHFILFFESQLKSYFLTYDNEWFNRPMNAENCGLLNNGGYAGDQCGFPSGHSISTSFYYFLYYFQHQNKIKDKRYLLILIHIPILLMGYARVMKNCHNLFQVFGGYLFGLFFSFIFY